MFESHPNMKFFNLRKCGRHGGNVLYPWNVLLIEKDPSGVEVSSCGGAMITNTTILTSAKCVTLKKNNT